MRRAKIDAKSIIQGRSFLDEQKELIVERASSGLTQIKTTPINQSQTKFDSKSKQDLKNRSLEEQLKDNSLTWSLKQQLRLNPDTFPMTYDNLYKAAIEKFGRRWEPIPKNPLDPTSKLRQSVMKMVKRKSILRKGKISNTRNTSAKKSTFGTRRKDPGESELKRRHLESSSVSKSRRFVSPRTYKKSITSPADVTSTKGSVTFVRTGSRFSSKRSIEELKFVDEEEYRPGYRAVTYMDDLFEEFYQKYFNEMPPVVEKEPEKIEIETVKVDFDTKKSMKKNKDYLKKVMRRGKIRYDSMLIKSKIKDSDFRRVMMRSGKSTKNLTKKGFKKRYKSLPTTDSTQNMTKKSNNSDYNNTSDVFVTGNLRSRLPIQRTFIGEAQLDLGLTTPLTVDYHIENESTDMIRRIFFKNILNNEEFKNDALLKRSGFLKFGDKTKIKYTNLKEMNTDRINRLINIKGRRVSYHPGVGKLSVVDELLIMKEKMQRSSDQIQQVKKEIKEMVGRDVLARRRLHRRRSGYYYHQPIEGTGTELRDSAGWHEYTGGTLAMPNGSIFDEGSASRISMREEGSTVISKDLEREEGRLRRDPSGYGGTATSLRKKRSRGGGLGASVTVGGKNEGGFGDQVSLQSVLGRNKDRARYEESFKENSLQAGSLINDMKRGRSAGTGATKRAVMLKKSTRRQRRTSRFNQSGNKLTSLAGRSGEMSKISVTENELNSALRSERRLHTSSKANRKQFKDHTDDTGSRLQRHRFLQSKKRQSFADIVLAVRKSLVNKIKPHLLNSDEDDTPAIAINNKIAVGGSESQNALKKAQRSKILINANNQAIQRRSALKNKIKNHLKANQPSKVRKSRWGSSEVFKKKTNKEMKNLSQRVQKLVKVARCFEDLRKRKANELEEQMLTMEKDRLFKNKILKRKFSELLEQKPNSAHHIRDMRTLGEAHRRGLYRKKVYLQSFEMFRRAEKFYEIHALRMSLKCLKVFKDILEYHRLLLFEGASFTQRDSDNLYGYLEANNMIQLMSNYDRNGSVKVGEDSEKLERIKHRVLNDAEIEFLEILQKFYLEKCMIDRLFIVPDPQVELESLGRFENRREESVKNSALN